MQSLGMPHVRRDRQRHCEALGYEQLVERPAVGQSHVDQGPPIPIALFHITFDYDPLSWRHQPLGER
jgi:hypothetical protein